MPQDPYAAIAQPSAGSDPYAAIAKAPESSKAAPTSFPETRRIGGELGDMANGIVKNIFDVSTPGIAASLLKKFRAGLLPARFEKDVTPLEKLPNEIGATMAPIIAGGMMEGEPTLRPQARPSASAPSTDPAVIDRLADVLKRRAGDIPGVKIAKDLDYIVNGPKAPAPPTPKAPPTPVPTTDGIPWGSGGQGPIELRGKAIPVPQRTPSAELDATDENVPYAGAKPPKFNPNAYDATSENKPFAGGMDEFIPKRYSPPTAESAPEAATIPERATPSSAKATVPKEIDPLLERLRAFAAKIQEEEAAAPKQESPRGKRPSAPVIPTSDDDLLDLLHRSLKEIHQEASSQ